MHIPTVVKLLTKAKINVRELTTELYNASITARTEVIKTLILEDEAYIFKATSPSFSDEVSLYASDDDGRNWQWVDSFIL